jgi:hypothetical protein
VSASYAAATVLLDAFRRLFRPTDSNHKKNSPPTVSATLKQELYELVQAMVSTLDTSQRVLHALPATYPQVQRVLLLDDNDDNENKQNDIDFGVLYQEQSTRSISWLHDHGTCVDHIQVGKSTLEYAGSGAFAKRFLPKGTLIAASPLHHMFRNLTNMYTPIQNNHTKNNNHTTNKNNNDNDTTNEYNQPVKRAGQQLLLNYCFGRIHESSLLLCPYGPGVNFINHNQTLTNVRVRWAADGTSSHNATWLSLTPIEMAWNYKISLGIDYVALKDIAKGDELFMDYGDAWEKAWWDHVQRWNRYNPPQGKSSFWSPSYQSAARFNAQLQRDEPLRTQEEQINDPYPSQLRLVCHMALEAKPEGLDCNLDTLGINMWDQGYEFEWFETAVARPCAIVNRWSSSSSSSFVNTNTDDASDNDDEEVEGTCTTATTSTDVWYYDVHLLLKDNEFDDDEDDPSPPYESVPVLRRRVPRRAISFIDAPFTTDMHLKHAFRHDIQIPNTLFPPAWKDKNPTKKEKSL